MPTPKPREVIEATVMLLVALAFFYMIPGALITIWLVEKYPWAARNKAWLIWVICLSTATVIFLLLGKCPMEGCGIGSDAPEYATPRPY